MRKLKEYCNIKNIFDSLLIESLNDNDNVARRNNALFPVQCRDLVLYHVTSSTHWLSGTSLAGSSTPTRLFQFETWYIRTPFTCMVKWRKSGLFTETMQAYMNYSRSCNVVLSNVINMQLLTSTLQNQAELRSKPERNDTVRPLRK